MAWSAEKKREYGKSYYRAHKDRWSSEYLKRGADRPCRVAGCPEPRYVSPSGYVRATCRSHENARLREAFRSRRTSELPYIPRSIPPAERPCLGGLEGNACERPRFVTWAGKVDSRCADHSIVAPIRPYLDEYDRRRPALIAQSGDCACCERRLRIIEAHWDGPTLVCRRCHLLLVRLATPEARAAVASYLTRDKS